MKLCLCYAKVNLQFIIQGYNKTAIRKEGNYLYRIARFMQGRYGTDKLFFGICILAVILSFVNIFTRSVIVQIIVYLLIILSFLRVFSRNIQRRNKENQKFCAVLNKITGTFKLAKRMWKDRKTHCYVKCSNCKKVLRLPKKKGVHTVKCPNCSNSFQVKI